MARVSRRGRNDVVAARTCFDTALHRARRTPRRCAAYEDHTMATRVLAAEFSCLATVDDVVDISRR